MKGKMRAFVQQWHSGYKCKSLLLIRFDVFIRENHVCYYNPDQKSTAIGTGELIGPSRELSVSVQLNYQSVKLPSTYLFITTNKYFTQT